MRSRRCSHSRETPAASRNVSSRDGSVTGRLAEKGRQLGGEAGGGHLVLADGDDGAACIFVQRGDPVRAGDLADARNGGGLPPASSLARSDSYSGLLCSSESRTFMGNTSKTGFLCNRQRR